MAKQKRVAKAQPVKKQPAKTGPAPVAELANVADGLSTLSGALFDATGQGRAGGLDDPRLQTAQRQVLALQIGQAQGNHYLQRTIASLQRPQPQPKIEPRLAQSTHLVQKREDGSKTAAQ